MLFLVVASRENKGILKILMVRKRVSASDLSRYKLVHLVGLMVITSL